MAMRNCEPSCDQLVDVDAGGRAGRWGEGGLGLVEDVEALAVRSGSSPAP